MMTVKTSPIRILLALLLVTAICGTGCLFSSPVRNETGDTQPEYSLPPDTPDKLVGNFQECWQKRDINHYADHVLFAPDTEAADGNTSYMDFEFFFLNPDDPGIPSSSWFYQAEVDAVTAMFNDREGEDHNGNVVPAIKSIKLDLIKLAPGWEDANNGAAGTYNGVHDFPAGTQHAVYETDMTITLTEANAGGYDAYQVNGHLEFWVIPVKGENDATEYRIWKWRDIDY